MGLKYQIKAQYSKVKRKLLINANACRLKKTNVRIGTVLAFPQNKGVLQVNAAINV